VRIVARGFIEAARGFVVGRALRGGGRVDDVLPFFMPHFESTRGVAVEKYGRRGSLAPSARLSRLY
jgi:hypothetical protein